jgi:hypothetical protein
MDDDDFEDLFAGSDMLPGSQESLNASLTAPENDRVLRSIEKIFEDIAASILREESLAIPLNTPCKTRGSLPTAAADELPSASMRTRQICFPGKTAREAWRFSTRDCYLP